MRKKAVIVGLAFVVLSFGAITFYRLFFLHFVRIPTGSMANTILPGDHLVVKKRAFGDIRRGDLIVFRYPDDAATYFLSRVIGLPGETLDIRERIVYVNNKELMEQRVTIKQDNLITSDHLEELSSEGSGSYRVFYQSDEDSSARDDRTKGPFQIPDNQYFVMGDNRDNSIDSRYRGAVARQLIFGKPFMIYWSRTGYTGEDHVRWDRLFTRVR